MAVFPEVGQTRVEREKNGNGREKAADGVPGEVEPCRRLGNPVGAGQEEEEVNNGDDLPGGFVFAEAFGGEHDAFLIGEGAQPRDEKLAAYNGDDHPGGKGTQRNEQNKGGCGEDFIGKGIHEFAEVGDELPAAGQKPIEIIGDGCQQEDRKCHGVVEAIVRGQSDDKNDRESQSGEGELVGKIHRRKTGRVWMGSGGGVLKGLWQGGGAFECGDGKGREIDLCRPVAALPGDGFGPVSAIVAHIGAAISLRVGVENFLVESFSRESQSVAAAHNGGRIDHKKNGVAVAGFAHKRPDRVVRVVKINPLESIVGVILIEEGGLGFVEPVEVLDEAAEAVVERALGEVPVQRTGVIPLGPLAELAALKEELFAGMRPHPGIEHAEVGKFLPGIARHFVEKRALAVDDFIVTENKDEMLVEGIEHREGDVTLMVASVDGFAGNVAETVIHPAHIPFEPEAQAAKVGRAGDTRPGGGFFRDGHDARVATVAEFVEAFEKINRLEVLASTEAVGLPFPGLAGIVEIQHGGHSIHAEAVEVILVEPEEGVAMQEVFYFVAGVVEDEGAPVLVFSLAGIFIFVEAGAVVAGEAVRVFREVSGHPVEQDSDAFLVAAIHEVSEFIGGAETA